MIHIYMYTGVYPPACPEVRSECLQCLSDFYNGIFYSSIGHPPPTYLQTPHLSRTTFSTQFSIDFLPPEMTSKRPPQHPKRRPKISKSNQKSQSRRKLQTLRNHQFLRCSSHLRHLSIDPFAIPRFFENALANTPSTVHRFLSIWGGFGGSRRGPTNQLFYQKVHFCVDRTAIQQKPQKTPNFKI